MATIKAEHLLKAYSIGGIEELEKLREELEQEYDAPYESYPNTKIGLGVAIGYINKRLDELKGELVNGETTE